MYSGADSRNVQVKVGIEGAEEFGDFEEWFNYRLSRAAPETCAKFLGSFVADKTNSQFTKGGKWLVWKFEVLYQIFPLDKYRAIGCLSMQPCIT